MDDEAKLPDFPQRDSRSAAYQVARTAIDAATSIIPGGSYAAGAIVEHFVAAPLQKRRDEWFERVGLAIQQLQEQVNSFDPATLAENEDFITATFEATQCAMKTKNEEKLEALKNAVLNVASGITLDDTLRGAFFSLIDRFTPAHIHVLKMLHNPSAFPAMADKAKGVWAGSQMSILREAIPQSMVSADALSRILSDFEREGLAQTSGMSAMGTAGSLLAKRTTTSGHAFLTFIENPLAR